MTTHLADFDAQRTAFRALLEANCADRILLVSGESGSGKTALLTHCQTLIHSQVAHLPMQLRGATVSVAEIFYRFGGRLGWEHLTSFTKAVDHLQASPTVTIDRNWLLGINNHINVALHAENPTDRDERRAILTSAWFEDIQALDRLVLVMFDTYEQATTEVKDWISGPFLARAARVDRMRVVVAGQEVPPGNNIEWGNCCCAHRLVGVLDAKHWLPVLMAMGKLAPSSPPETFLDGVCRALQGKPGEIIKIIEGLSAVEASA